jgi:hypothetical protein
MVLPEEAAVALSAAVHPHPAEATQVVPAQDHGEISVGGYQLAVNSWRWHTITA